MFKAIPGFSKYAITEQGVIKNTETDSILPWHQSNGYIFVRIVDDYGRRVSIGQHRALALTYLEMPNTSEAVTVNHKDGNKSNNALGNLEWATYTENQLHSYMTGLRKDRLPSIARNKKTGEVKEFFSKGDLSRSFGIQMKGLQGVGRYFEIGDWEIEFLIDRYTPQNTNKYPEGLLVRNIYTGLSTFCNNETEAGKIVGAHPKVIVRVLANQRFEYPLNGHDIRPFDSELIWPSYTNEELEAFRGSFFIHVAIRASSDTETYLFPSVKATAERMGYHERHIRYLVANGIRCGKGFSYTEHRRAVDRIQ